MPLSRPDLYEQHRKAHTDVHAHTAEECREKCEHKGGKTWPMSAQCAQTAAAHVKHAHGSHYIPLLLFQRVHLSSVWLLP